MTVTSTDYLSTATLAGPKPAGARENWQPGGPVHGFGPDHPPTLFDHLRLPTGKTIKETGNDELRGIFAKLNIDGAHVDGRNVLCERYGELLNKIHSDAGNAAVAAFLEANKG